MPLLKCGAPSFYLDPGVPDQERVLARRGIALVGTVKSGALVDVEARGSPLAEAAASIRAFSRRAIASAVGRWSMRAAGIVTAIVIGDRTGLDDAVERRLQEAGTYHVIAISGGNIAILAGLTLVVFRMAGFLGRGAMFTRDRRSRRLRISRRRRRVGRSRHADGGRVLRRPRARSARAADSTRSCSWRACCWWRDPLAVVDPAFLLTFGATAAILVVSARAQRTAACRGWPRRSSAMLMASASAEAALLPVGATIFSRVTFAGLALNFFAIPLMAVAQIAGMVVVPLFALSGQSRIRSSGGSHTSVRRDLSGTANLVRFAPVVTWRVAPPQLLVSGALLRRRAYGLVSLAPSRPADRQRRV